MIALQAADLIMSTAIYVVFKVVSDGPRQARPHPPRVIAVSGRRPGAV